MTQRPDWKLSHVESLAPPLRRVFLFGSLGQLVSYVAIIAGLLLPVLLWIEPRLDIVAALTGGAVIASIPAVLAALPARLVVRIGHVPTPDAVHHHFDTVLRGMGYVVQRTDSGRHYRTRGTWLARWREHECRLLQAADHIVIIGPRNPLVRLRQQTVAWLSATELPRHPRAG